MKRVNNLFDKINDIDVIMNMYSIVRKNTKNKHKVSVFDDFYSSNIIAIKNRLNNYIPNRYNIFLIKEPKYRIIMSQQLQDKVINHLVAKYFLIDVFDKYLLDENCATRIGKGTHYALKQFKRNYNYYKNKYEKFYVLKIDISKYFYNIDHEIVKKLTRKKIKDKRTLELIDIIIDSTDLDYVNETIDKLKNNEIKRISSLNIKNKEAKIKEINNLPYYKKGKGCSIGNVSSQIIATFYLNELDHFIKEKLKIKFTRYMDDIVLIHENKNYLKKSLIQIEKILDKYKLKLNKKTRIYSSNEEIEFLGFRFINNKKIIMKLNNKTKNNLKLKMNFYNKNRLFNDKYISVRDSYKGHLRYGGCNRLIHKYLECEDKFLKKIEESLIEYRIM